jgi:hypothetical protein
MTKQANFRLNKGVMGLVKCVSQMPRGTLLGFLTAFQ